MGFETEVSTLIADLVTDNPRLYQALSLLNKSIGEIDRELHPSTRQSSIATPTTTDALAPPADFAVVSTGSTVRFTWAASIGAFQYEIRRGTTWSTASLVLRTTGLQADIDPLVYGDYTYLIKAMTIGSLYSLLANDVSISIPTIPAVVINAMVIDNNVLLSWSAPASVFTIAKYKIKREGSLYGYVNSTFFSFFEQAPATYTYSVTAIDIAGNEGVEQTIPVLVNTPPDFALQDSHVSDFSGTKTDVILLADGSLLCSIVTETWEEHFVDNGWTTIRDQIDAGFPIYAQPSKLTGSYEEVIDYGAVFTNNLAIATYNIQQLGATDVGVVVKMAVSADNVTYSAFVAGSVQFYPSFRYLKLRLEFTGASNKALAKISNLTLNLDVKRENDGGMASALSTDASGTEVFFTKAFKDVESITVSVESAKEPFKAIYAFTDIPSPTSFFVFVFDTTGNRVSKLVSWKARGIV